MKKRVIEVGQQYHLYARGTDKRDTFMEHGSYVRFMALIYACNTSERVNLQRVKFEDLNYLKIKSSDPIVQLDQFCLMPNHFHILCTEITEGGISKFMQKILSGYTNYFNKKHRRTGALFGTRYKIKHIHTDLYVSYIKKYIYFNPLKIIKPDYDSKDFILYEKEKLTLEEKTFLEEYPYKG